MITPALRPAVWGNNQPMTVMPDEVDPFIAQHVVAIRDRFGIDGLKDAARLIETEIAIFADAYDSLPTGDAPAS
jgi:hypothetical protein